MRKLFLSSVLACAALGLNATVIGDLNYNLDQDTWTAEVAPTPSATGDIVIPSSVETEDGVFTVVKIAQSAFENAKITSVIVPNTVTTVDMWAFRRSTVKTIKFGTGLTNLGSAVFMYCSIEDLYFYSTVPPTLAYATFNPNTNPYNSLGKIYVPAESLMAYLTASRWTDVAKKIEAMPSEGPDPVDAYALPFDFKMESYDQLGECLKVNSEDDWYVESMYVDYGNLFWYDGMGGAWLILPAVDFGEASNVSVSVNAIPGSTSFANAFEIYLGKEKTVEAMTQKVLSKEWAEGSAVSETMEVCKADAKVEGGVYYPAIRMAEKASIMFNNFSIVEAEEVGPGVGVEAIEAEDGVAVEYFNMQGMRVANPEEGQLVIVRKGNKAFKVVR